MWYHKSEIKNIITQNTVRNCAIKSSTTLSSFQFCATETTNAVNDEQNSPSTKRIRKVQSKSFLRTTKSFYETTNKISTSDSDSKRKNIICLWKKRRSWLHQLSCVSSFLLYYWIKVLAVYSIFTQQWISGKILTDENGPLSEVQTAVGLEVALPCDLVPATTMSNDKVQLVIWYTDGSEKPIYTFDARGKPLQQATHWADQNVLKTKAHFYYDTNPPALSIKGVQKDDAGLYRCRVDFHKSPTRNWRINLTVLVPPTQLIVLDTLGAAAIENVIGPYNEGASINVTCLSSGGIPPPRVSWWKEHALLDDSFQALPDGTVKNVLHLSKIMRKDLHSVYTCQASNGHVVPPLSSTVKLDMKLPPLYVRIQGLNHPLVAGVRTQISCSSAGARPSPQIIWNKGGQMMRGATQSISSDGNVTISELVFIPAPEDNEKQVICSVTAESLSVGTTGVFLKDTRTLDVKHAPIVSLNLGAPLDPNKLFKGADVYLECDIKANPPAKKVEWFHDDKQLHSSRGIIIANQTLVLQGLSKATHGQYLCKATNVQGGVASNEVYLDVKYPPVCSAESTVIRAALKQIVNITCDVDSNPMLNLTYKWHFNNSLETVVELPQTYSTTGQHFQHRSAQKQHSSSVDNNESHSNGEWSSSALVMKNGNSDDDETMIMSADSAYGHKNPTTELNVAENQPYSQMVYSNLAYQQHLEKNRLKHKQDNVGSGNSEKRRSSSNNQLNDVYRYRVETFQQFGTVSCIASNSIGHSTPCLYHIVAAELPDPVKNCTAFNATANSIQMSCQSGNDGGIQQHFHVEIYDELNRQVIYNISYKNSDFTIKRLPSDSVFVIRVTSYNLQGFSGKAFRVRAKTLSAPLLRTASSTAVLVQLTPLLGALVGVVATLILVAVCIVIFIKLRTKHTRNGGDPVTTETDKGSAEPLSRNMGSHSSLEDKNPDVVPQENSEDEYNSEEKAFDRLNMESQRILYTPPRLNSTSPPPLSPTFAKQYGELSLTTNPSFALYNSPQRAPAVQRPVYTAPPTLLSTRSPPNIYTRIPPARTYLPYETRTSPTSPYGTTTAAGAIACTVPLLNGSSLTMQQPHQTQLLHQSHHQPSSLLITSGGGILGNYDDTS